MKLKNLAWILWMLILIISAILTALNHKGAALAVNVFAFYVLTLLVLLYSRK